MDLWVCIGKKQAHINSLSADPPANSFGFSALQKVKHLSYMCFLHEAEPAPGEGWYHKTRWGISEILGPCETAQGPEFQKDLFYHALFEQKNKEMTFFFSLHWQDKCTVVEKVKK